MFETLIYAGGVLLLAILLAAVVAVVVLWRKIRRQERAVVDRAQAEAQRIVAEATTERERILRDADVEARERLLAARTEFERETREHRVELAALEQRLDRREETLDERTETVSKREERVEELENRLSAQVAEASRKDDELRAILDEQRARLEQVAGMTVDQAKQELMNAMEQEVRIEAANRVKRIEDEATEKAKERARYIISMAIERIASEHVVESTVSVVDLPSDDMKGRIIGREGRNIRAFEKITGVDVIVDDTPEAVILSSFEPVRRQIACLALERLVQDGRIHPARIEEVVDKVRTEMDEKLLADGEAAALEVGIPDLHPELLRMIGRLQFRSSYGQNALKHSMEVAWLAHHMASELGVDAEVARRAGFLHDIGKAIDREMEGTHLELGRELLHKHGETDAVVHAMECHHGDYDPHSIEAVLISAADALSAARPGARREVLENYVKRLEKLENLASEFKGVDKAYAIQAGRELRILVESAKVSDEEALWMARDVAKKVEGELTYPGQIKVTIIRETRAVEYAR